MTSKSEKIEIEKLYEFIQCGICLDFFRLCFVSGTDWIGSLVGSLIESLVGSLIESLVRTRPFGRLFRSFTQDSRNLNADFGSRELGNLDIHWCYRVSMCIVMDAYINLNQKVITNVRTVRWLLIKKLMKCSNLGLDFWQLQVVKFLFNMLVIFFGCCGTSICHQHRFPNNFSNTRSPPKDLYSTWWKYVQREHQQLTQSNSKKTTHVIV